MCISEAEKYQKSLYRGKKAGQAGSTAPTKTTPPSTTTSTNGNIASNGDDNKKRKREETDANERAAKKSKVEEKREESKNEATTSEEVHSTFDLNTLKWRRSIKRALKQGGGKMQLSSLETKAIDVLLQDTALRAQLQQLFKQKVINLFRFNCARVLTLRQIRSSKFTVEGECVTLK